MTCRCSFPVAMLALVCLTAGAASAGVCSPTDLFPVAGTWYEATNELWYPMGVMVRGMDLVPMGPYLLPPPVGEGSHISSFFDVFLEVSLDGGESWSPVGTSGPGTVWLFNLGGQGGERLFEAEMVQLDLAGGGLPPGVMIRESPTHPSLGQHTILDQAGGGYQIDSFFDVFTELSVDGGQTWMPALAPMHVVIMPEPATIALLGLGGLGLVARLRRR